MTVSVWWLVLAYVAGQVTAIGALFVGEVLRYRSLPHDSEPENVNAEASYLTEQMIARLRARRDPSIVDLAAERRRRRGGAA